MKHSSLGNIVILTRRATVLSALKTRLAAPAVLAWIGCLAGCSGGAKLYDVKGTVNIDGKPTGGVSLQFFDQTNNQLTASAKSDPDGSFTFYSMRDNDSKRGIPVGKYSVVATYPDPNFKPPKMGMMGGTPPDPPDMFKGKYALPSMDNFVEIQSAGSSVSIELSSKKK